MPRLEAQPLDSSRMLLPSPPVAALTAGRCPRHRRLLCFSSATPVQQCVPVVVAPRGDGPEHRCDATTPVATVPRWRHPRRRACELYSTRVAGSSKKVRWSSKKTCRLQQKKLVGVAALVAHRSKKGSPVAVVAPPCRRPQPTPSSACRTG